MVKVPITVRGQLEIEIEALPDQALDLIKASLSFENEEKQTAAREKVRGWWDLPDTVDLWHVEDRRVTGNVVTMPRGFAFRLNEIMASLNAQPVFDDQRVDTMAAEGYFEPFVLRDYQLDAVLAMMGSEQGFLQQPAGGGKTNTMLGLASYLKRRTLVIMDKADIVDQWRERAAQFLNLPLDFEDELSTGKIGMGIWEERDLTIALRQTLWSKIDELDATRWWDRWGLTIYDEGQHLAADTLAEVSRRCISKFMFGCSATPARTRVKGKIVEALVGPVVHRTERQVLRDRGILMHPTLRRIDTDFEADFWETHDSRKDGECDVPNCPKAKNGKKHGHRNNYQSVLKKVKNDKDRNAMIAKNVVSERDHIHLIPSRHLNHLDVLKKAIEEAGWDGPIFYLRGEENARSESRGIVEQIMKAHEAVILSTVADEALDVPPIDRVHLVFPMRQSAATEQLIGRAERSWNGKNDSIVYDYVDAGCEVLLSQSIERQATYKRLGLKGA